MENVRVLPARFHLLAEPPVFLSGFFLPVVIDHPKDVDCTAVDLPSDTKALSNRYSSPG